MDLTVMWWMHNIPPPLKLMLLFLFFSVTLCILNYEYPPCLTTPVFHMLHANIQHSTVLSMDTMHTGAFHVTHHATHVYSRDQLLPTLQKCPTVHRWSRAFTTPTFSHTPASAHCNHLSQRRQLIPRCALVFKYTVPKFPDHELLRDSCCTR